MHDFDRGFRINDTFIEWGTSLAEAAHICGIPPERCREVGYSTLSVPCCHAYGFETIFAQMKSYGLTRPVMGLDYELAPLSDGSPEPTPWLRPLLGMLGAPSQEDMTEVGDQPNPSNVVRYHARWETADFAVILSIYGAPRTLPGGRSAGTFWLYWPVQKAAVPFLAEWRSACEALAAAAEGAKDFRLFRVGFDQHAQYGGADALADVMRREASLALMSPDMLQTPAVIAERLSPRDFALWSNPAAKLYCLSTRWDSIAWEAGKAPKIEWWHVRPAKGAGKSSLHVGGWFVADCACSETMQKAVAALESIPGVRVNRMDGGYDC